MGLDVHPWLAPHLALAVPVKAFEYMAAGCALVSSHLPEFERLLEPQDRAQVAIAHGDDPATYARVILDLLADAVVLDARAAHLRRRVAERYSWVHEEGALRALYLAVVAAGEVRG